MSLLPSSLDIMCIPMYRIIKILEKGDSQIPSSLFFLFRNEELSLVGPVVLINVTGTVKVTALVAFENYCIFI
jgi:hypothetical protein